MVLSVAFNFLWRKSENNATFGSFGGFGARGCGYVLRGRSVCAAAGRLVDGAVFCCCCDELLLLLKCEQLKGSNKSTEKTENQTLLESNPTSSLPESSSRSSVRFSSHHSLRVIRHVSRMLRAVSLCDTASCLASEQQQK